MPDATGRLSPVEIRAILQWLTDRHGGVPYSCPISDEVAWAVNPYVYQHSVYPIQSVDFPSISMVPWPVVQVACAGCGYAMYFSASVIGLYPNSGKTTEAE